MAQTNPQSSVLVEIPPGVDPDLFVNDDKFDQSLLAKFTPRSQQILTDAIARRDAPKERSWTDAAASTALRVIPAVAGGMAGALAGPLAPYAVPALGAAGSTLGEYLGNLYEGEDATSSELLTSALIGALPTGKLVTGAGQAVLRTIAPGVERKLAGALASKAAPSGARAFERLKSANVLGLAAKGAAQGAPTAAIENTIARTVQGQPTTLSDLGRDVAIGAAKKQQDLT